MQMTNKFKEFDEFVTKFNPILSQIMDISDVIEYIKVLKRENIKRMKRRNTKHASNFDELSNNSK